MQHQRREMRAKLALAYAKGQRRAIPAAHAVRETTSAGSASKQTLAQTAAPAVEVKPKTWQVQYFHNDQIGTPRELTNEQGELTWAASYKAWGNTLKVEWLQTEATPEEKAHQPLRFQGQYFDAETGLHYNRFRYYDPDQGRFCSRDPIGLVGGENLRQYAPNPSGWVDPTGLACWQDKFRKRPKEEVEKLRREFDSKHRGEYLKQLASTPGADRAFSADQLAAMRNGNAPLGSDGKLMVVHHKVPLFRGGENATANFDLLTASEHQQRMKDLHYYPDGKNP